MRIFGSTAQEEMSSARLKLLWLYPVSSPGWCVANTRRALRAYHLGTYPRNFDHVDIRSCGSDGCNTEVSLLAAVFGGGVRPLRRSNRRCRLVRSEWLQGWVWGAIFGS